VPTGDLTLQQAADHLGVHYMTAYRYVKLGLLYAEKRGGSWMITHEDLAAFEGIEAEKRPETGSLEDALVAGDEATAWQVIEAAVAEADDAVDVHLDVLSPALVSIGQRWAEGELSIASEHKASAVATRLISRLGTELTTPGRRRGIVILGAAPGDVHSIPSAMFADIVRSFGVNVVDLGGSPDIASFVEAARRHPDAVVAISLTGPGHEASARTVVDALRREVADLPIALGGGAITSAAQASSLGADLWHDDHRTAAQMIAEAAAERAAVVRSAV
jgi:excisionase family DNA binding protein